MRSLIIGIVVVMIGVLAGWYAIGSPKPSFESILPGEPQDQARDTSNTPTPTPTGTGIYGDELGFSDSQAGGTGQTKGGVNERTVITYTDSGFVPGDFSASTGETVAFINDSSLKMKVVGVGDTPEKFGQSFAVGRGGSYEFVFENTGTYEFTAENTSHTGHLTVNTQ